MKWEDLNKVMISSSQLKQNKIYYTYVDYTTEIVPRPFYVGKGIKNRVENSIRNYKHSTISKKFGFNRIIEFETNIEIEAYKREIELIAELHTFVEDELATEIVCNFTKGGDGIFGVNERQIQQFDVNDVLIATYPTIASVAKNFNVTSSVISNALSGRGVYPIEMRNFKWKSTKQANKCKKKHRNSILVMEINPITLEVLGEYSITECLKRTKYSYTTFSKLLRFQTDDNINRLIKRTGSIWRFSNPENKLPRSRKHKECTATSSKCIKVTYVDGTERIFPSINVALIELDIHPTILYKKLNGEDKTDYQCSFVNEQDSVHIDFIRSKSWYDAQLKNNGIKVIKTTLTGEIIENYGSISQAEKANGFQNREIYSALSNNLDYICDGFIWKKDV